MQNPAIITEAYSLKINYTRDEVECFQRTMLYFRMYFQNLKQLHSQYIVIIQAVDLLQHCDLRSSYFTETLKVPHNLHSYMLLSEHTNTHKQMKEINE